MPEIFCVIMAGGSGERFWPKSRKKNPKQLLSLLGAASLIEQTVSRLAGFVAPEKILVITNRLYAEKIHNLCPEIPEKNIIGEPCAKDTAPCMALASGIVKAKAETENPLIIVLPADHYIPNREAMIADFKEAGNAAMKENAIVTVGIIPTFPSSDYGYIECGQPVPGYDKVFQVSRFLEKPTIANAEKFLKAGTFKWNGGIFLFTLNTIIREFTNHAKDMACLLNQTAESFLTEHFEDTLNKMFSDIRKISFDYAVMEHTKHVLTKDAAFDWDDVGNWTALRNYRNKDSGNNIVSGPVSLLDCENCIVYVDGQDQLIAGIDLKDMVIVKTPDAILITPSSSTPKIKTLLKQISVRDGGEKYL